MPLTQIVQENLTSAEQELRNLPNVYREYPWLLLYRSLVSKEVAFQGLFDYIRAANSNSHSRLGYFIGVKNRPPEVEGYLQEFARPINDDFYKLVKTRLLELPHINAYIQLLIEWRTALSPNIQPVSKSRYFQLYAQAKDIAYQRWIRTSDALAYHDIERDPRGVGLISEALNKLLFNEIELSHQTGNLTPIQIKKINKRYIEKLWWIYAENYRQQLIAMIEEGEELWTLTVSQENQWRKVRFTQPGFAGDHSQILTRERLQRMQLKKGIYTPDLVEQGAITKVYNGPREIPNLRRTQNIEKYYVRRYKKLCADDPKFRELYMQAVITGFDNQLLAILRSIDRNNVEIENLLEILNFIINKPERIDHIPDSINGEFYIARSLTSQEFPNVLTQLWCMNPQLIYDYNRRANANDMPNIEYVLEYLKDLNENDLPSSMPSSVDGLGFEPSNSSAEHQHEAQKQKHWHITKISERYLDPPVNLALADLSRQRDNLDLNTEAIADYEIASAGRVTIVNGTLAIPVDRNFELSQLAITTLILQPLELGVDYCLSQEAGTGLPIIEFLYTQFSEVLVNYSISRRDSELSFDLGNQQVEQSGLQAIIAAFSSYPVDKIPDIVHELNRKLEGHTPLTFKELSRIFTRGGNYSFDPQFCLDQLAKGVDKFIGFVSPSTNLFHFQCDGANALYVEVLNVYFQEMRLPYAARVRACYHPSGINDLTKGDLHAYTEIIDTNTGKVLHVTDTTPAAFGENRANPFDPTIHFPAQTVLDETELLQTLSISAQNCYKNLQAILESQNHPNLRYGQYELIHDLMRAIKMIMHHSEPAEIQTLQKGYKLEDKNYSPDELILMASQKLDKIERILAKVDKKHPNVLPAYLRHEPTRQAIKSTILTLQDSINAYCSTVKEG